MVVLSGSGMSAPSGVATFRDARGLWCEFSVEEVATPEAFAQHPQRVLDFYNRRRLELAEVEPNAGHYALAELENRPDTRVTIITQNVDDLHERAGSSRVVHLHGELIKVRSAENPDDIREIGYTEIQLGDLCPQGHQLRPHIVWFGEIPMRFDEAQRLVQQADILLVVGTSLSVYPAASLAGFAPQHAQKFFIDLEGEHCPPEFMHVQQSAEVGVPQAILHFL